MDISGTNGKLLVQLMSASSLRQKVIGNNIANQNVPGFKRQDVRFEGLVQEELASSARQVGAEVEIRFGEERPWLDMAISAAVNSCASRTISLATSKRVPVRSSPPSLRRSRT